jgi:hypothetical protein
MVKHGFSYSDLKEMDIDEISFWAKELDEYYKQINDELDDAV